jgi:hypothetical protein
VRQGASWTAAYHRQLTVPAVARPVPSSVVPSASLLPSGPGGCSPGRRLPAGASSCYQAVGRRRGRPGQQAHHGVGRRCPAGGVHPSGLGVRGSGCPAVRCPVSWGGRPEVRRSAVCCPPVCCPPVRCPPVRCPPVWCLPRRSGRVGLLRCSGGGVGDSGRGGRATMTTGTGGGSAGCRAVDASTTVAEAGTRATLPTSGWSVGGRWRTRVAGWVRAAAAALAR